MSILFSPIDNLVSTASRTINRFKSIDIITFFDLIHYFPRAYKDIPEVISIRILKQQEFFQEKSEIYHIIGTIIKSSSIYIPRKHISIQKMLIQDATDSIELIWYNQQYVLKLIKPNTKISVLGTLNKKGYLHTSFNVQDYEILSENNLSLTLSGIIPVYEAKKGLSSKLIESKIQQVLASIKDELNEFLPDQILKKYKLISLQESYITIHKPSNYDSLSKAKYRLGFNELLLMFIKSNIIKSYWKKQITKKKYTITSHRTKIASFISHFPYTLTKSQNKCINEILSDLKRFYPMNRLLQGDVGSGKTSVAAVSIYASFLNNTKVLFMAPTEILAQQHYKTLQSIFKGKYKLSLQLITGKSKSIRTIDADCIIGTHALISKSRNYNNVGLIIIDEQHRFGVEQRNSLKLKGLNPHILSMTATPIPRTICLTKYGELDISILQDLPKGRKKVKTYIIAKNKRNAMYDWIKKEIKEKHIQVFIVCPLIEDTVVETEKTKKSALSEYNVLSKTIFSKFTVGLLHGKMKAEEKNSVMQKFKQNKINILVCTSVVEVGIDIPNASIMIIEGASHYGLSQLHQLRGRVGRGKEQGYCFLFSDDLQENSRLKYFQSHHSGFDLSEFDFKNRGAGELYGIRQHGLSYFKIASLMNEKLVLHAKNASKEINIQNKRFILSPFTLGIKDIKDSVSPN